MGRNILASVAGSDTVGEHTEKGVDLSSLCSDNDQVFSVLDEDFNSTNNQCLGDAGERNDETAMEEANIEKLEMIQAIPKSRVLFAWKPLDLSIYTFDEPPMEPIEDEAHKTDQPVYFVDPIEDDPLWVDDVLLDKDKLNQSFEELFEEELACMDEHIKEVLVNATHLNGGTDPSYEELFEEEIKFLSNGVEEESHGEEDDEFTFSMGNDSKNHRRRLNKRKSKEERSNVKLKRKLSSSLSPLKRTHWNSGKRSRGWRPKGKFLPSCSK